jgi:hypothetical protein
MQVGGGTLRMDGRIAALAAMLAVSVLGCAGTAWRHARGEDSIAAYHAFLEDYPNSRFSDQARARLDLARLKKRPTRAGADAFRAKYSDPELVAELDPFVEDLLFRHARAIGTADAYREFLARYPSGSLSTTTASPAIWRRSRSSPTTIPRAITRPRRVAVSRTCGCAVRLHSIASASSST